MNHDSIERIRESYEAISAAAGPMIARFYELLFLRAPAARQLFPADMTRQKQHLLAALATVARNLHESAALEQPLRELGVRHVKYGALPEHYPLVRDALLEAIAEALGEKWTDTLRADWRAALDAVAAAMQRGARGLRSLDAG
jgi:hemoglobin-like flavoprotein